MRYPQFLHKNGTIGFVAPSYGCAAEPYYTAFMHAIDKFHAAGYQTQLGPNCLVELGVGISNTPELCGKELNESYLGEENDAIISCGGGELMCEVVPYIDFEAIAKAKPKWYMGFSDNTNFTFLSTTLCDTAAIYGPCASAFGMEPLHPSVQDAFDLLCGRKDTFTNYDLWERESLKTEEEPLAPYNVTEPVVIRSFPGKDVHMQGRLIGGCMDCLVNLLGTRFDRVKDFNERYGKDGIIWFLEACDLNVMSIRRAIWEMKNAGWFSHLKGFLFGRPLCFGQEMFGIDQYEAVTALLKEYGVPVIMDLDIGHLSPMMPVVSGAMADVAFEDGTFTIRYRYE
ncbi:MAG: LD-carboxypeptidase [Muribaculaceae bacterium]|nr:LD-carboxypeptidase [Roseburia sp.]MCM1431776.1 LD-carboxypeptidase [Muribaculaceae bacterium]MCM1493358.1 LD-carboxypeptidase [Muribaculaceae bacterium]